MDNAPAEAPAPAPTGESVATPNTNTNTEQVVAPKAPDMHGFTSEDLAGMRTFIDNNGGWDKIKSRISNPQPTTVPEAQPQNPTSQPQYQPQQQMQPQPQMQQAYRPPQGSITAQEFLAQQYFQGLSHDPKYETISSQIASGDVLKEMAGFNIQPLNPDGSINDTMVRRYLDLKAQTVPAKPTESEPNASAAPTVTYTPVGDNIASIDEAYKVIMEKGHPATAKAEEFIKNYYSNSGKK